jgi:hypothetical protein
MLKELLWRFMVIPALMLMRMVFMIMAFYLRTTGNIVWKGVVEPRPIPGLSSPGTLYTKFIDDNTKTISSRADFEWQINETHMAKTGLEIIKHNIKKNQLENFLSVDEKRRVKYFKPVSTI